MATVNLPNAPTIAHSHTDWGHSSQGGVWVGAVKRAGGVKKPSWLLVRLWIASAVGDWPFVGEVVGSNWPLPVPLWKCIFGRFTVA